MRGAIWLFQDYRPHLEKDPVAGDSHSLIWLCNDGLNTQLKPRMGYQLLDTGKGSLPIPRRYERQICIDNSSVTRV
jgi:hypothetical protein